MREGAPPPPERTPNPFKVGDFVKFREDLPPETLKAIQTEFDLGTTYEVGHVTPARGYGKGTVYLKAPGTPGKGIPVSPSHLRHSPAH
jgi:hypothetical protein